MGQPEWKLHPISGPRSKVRLLGGQLQTRFYWHVNLSLIFKFSICLRFGEYHSTWHFKNVQMQASGSDYDRSWRINPNQDQKFRADENTTRLFGHIYPSKSGDNMRILLLVWRYQVGKRWLCRTSKSKACDDSDCYFMQKKIGELACFLASWTLNVTRQIGEWYSEIKGQPCVSVKWNL